MLGFVAGRLKLCVVPASHPCAAVERALQLKGLAYDRRILWPALQRHQPALARRAFPRHPGSIPAGTVPAEWLPSA
jgi:hypothetical protein